MKVKAVFGGSKIEKVMREGVEIGGGEGAFILRGRQGRSVLPQGYFTEGVDTM